jgi:hypothetical protein
VLTSGDHSRTTLSIPLVASTGRLGWQRTQLATSSSAGSTRTQAPAAAAAAAAAAARDMVLCMHRYPACVPQCIHMLHSKMFYVLYILRMTKNLFYIIIVLLCYKHLYILFKKLF